MSSCKVWYRLCVCLSVFVPHDKTKTAETKITKLGTGIVILVLGDRKYKKAIE